MGVCHMPQLLLNLIDVEPDCWRPPGTIHSWKWAWLSMRRCLLI